MRIARVLNAKENAIAWLTIGLFFVSAVFVILGIVAAIRTQNFNKPQTKELERTRQQRAKELLQWQAVRQYFRSE
jgi:hypothetical protein